MAVAGPATTQLADDNDDDGREMDFDNVLDFANQDLPCPQSYNGLIHWLISCPSLNILESDITQAFQGHPFLYQDQYHQEYLSQRQLR